MRPRSGGWEALGRSIVRGPYFPGDPERPGLEIATISHWLEDAEAVCRLIAAAPDLLAVAHMVLDGAMVETPSALIEAATAAIAKAEGR